MCISMALYNNIKKKKEDCDEHLFGCVHTAVVLITFEKGHGTTTRVYSYHISTWNTFRRGQVKKNQNYKTVYRLYHKNMEPGSQREREERGNLYNLRKN